MAPILETSDMEGFLRGQKIPFTSITPLSGGTANYVWRLHSPSVDAPTCVVKHAEDYVKLARHIQFPAKRMDFEARALRELPDLIHDARNPVHGARLYDYFEDEHVMIISDGGEQNLKDAYEGMTEEAVREAGRGLAVWLAALHKATSGQEEAKVELRKRFDNEVAKGIYRHSYRELKGAMQQRNMGEDVIRLTEKVNDEFGVLLQTDDECVCHGDFWTGNVLLDEANRLTIVDWEMVRRGCGATDVGQFAAEAWLLDRQRGKKGLCRSFIDAYAEAARGKEVSRGDMVLWTTRAAIHFGTHLAYWTTRVPWGSEEDTNAIVEIGLEVIRHAIDGDVDWLRTDTPFGSLLDG